MKAAETSVAVATVRCPIPGIAVLLASGWAHAGCRATLKILAILSMI